MSSSSHPAPPTVIFVSDPVASERAEVLPPPAEHRERKEGAQQRLPHSASLLKVRYQKGGVGFVKL